MSDQVLVKTQFYNGGLVDADPEEWHEALGKNLMKTVKHMARAHRIKKVTEIHLVAGSVRSIAGPISWELTISGDSGAWPDKPSEAE